MTTPKATGGKLSAERLAEIRSRIGSDWFGETDRRRLLGHIAALETRNRKLVEAIRAALKTPGLIYCADDLRVALKENDDAT